MFLQPSDAPFSADELLIVFWQQDGVHMLSICWRLTYLGV